MNIGLGYIFSWILTIAGAVAAVFDPVYGLMAYYMLSILRPPFLWFWSFDRNNPPNMAYWVALITLISWGSRGFGNWAWLRHIKLPMIGLATYLAAGTFAWLVCSPALGDKAFADAREALLIQAKIALMALVTVTLLTDTKRVKWFGWVIVLSLGYLAESFNEWYLLQPDRLAKTGWGGIDNNGTAMVMVTGVPLLFFFIINARAWWVFPRWSIQAFLFLLTAAMIHVVLFSFSRGGQLGLAIVALVLFVIAFPSLPRKGLILAAGAVLVFLAFYLAGHEVRERFATIFANPEERDASAASRFKTWGAAWQCIQDHPMGVGPRNFNLIAQQYGLESGKSVHNLFLQTGADYGIFGMLGMAVFYFTTVIYCFTDSLSETARRMVWPRYFMQMVTVAIVGFVTCSMFIGMEAVEIGFIVCLLGLTTRVVVRETAQTQIQTESGLLPEFEELQVSDKSQVPQPS